MTKKKKFLSLFLGCIAVLILWSAGMYCLDTITRVSDKTEVESILVGKWKVSLVRENWIQILSFGGEATVKFFDDNTYSAEGGCNEMFPHNTYTIVSDSEISLKAGGSLLACPKRIVEFHDLAKVHSYKLSKRFGTPVLYLYYSSSNVNGVFKLKKLTMPKEE